MQCPHSWHKPIFDKLELRALCLVFKRSSFSLAERMRETLGLNADRGYETSVLCFITCITKCVTRVDIIKKLNNAMQNV